NRPTTLDWTSTAASRPQTGFPVPACAAVPAAATSLRPRRPLRTTRNAETPAAPTATLLRSDHAAAADRPAPNTDRLPTAKRVRLLRCAPAPDPASGPAVRGMVGCNAGIQAARCHAPCHAGDPGRDTRPPA